MHLVLLQGSQPPGDHAGVMAVVVETSAAVQPRTWLTYVPRCWNGANCCVHSKFQEDNTNKNTQSD